MQRKGSKRHLTIKIKNETSLNISKNGHYANAIAFKIFTLSLSLNSNKQSKKILFKQVRVFPNKKAAKKKR